MKYLHTPRRIWILESAALPCRDRVEPMHNFTLCSSFLKFLDNFLRKYYFCVIDAFCGCFNDIILVTILDLASLRMEWPQKLVITSQIKLISSLLYFQLELKFTVINSIENDNHLVWQFHIEVRTYGLWPLRTKGGQTRLHLNLNGLNACGLRRRQDDGIDSPKFSTGNAWTCLS